MRFFACVLITLLLASNVYASGSYTLPFAKFYMENEAGDVIEILQHNERLYRIETCISGIKNNLEGSHIENIDIIDHKTIVLIYSVGIINGEIVRIARLQFISAEEESNSATLHKFLFRNGEFYERLDEKV